MSTVPQVFKIFSLDRYFVWSVEMREHYRQVGKVFLPTPSFFDNEDATRAFMYISYWLASLHVVCEGWQPLSRNLRHPTRDNDKLCPQRLLLGGV
jgi:hypothetical protein